MNKPNTKLLLNIPAVLLLGVVLQITGSYLVNAFCEIVSMHSDGVPSYILNQIDKYNSVITDLSSLEPRMIVYVIFAAPLIEEIVFRILFLRIFLKFIPFWAANLLQSLLFGIYHGGLIQGTYSFLMGLAIGAIFFYTKEGMKSSLIADLDAFIFGLFLHMTVNASGLYLAPLFPVGLPVNTQVIISLAGVIMVIALVIYAKVYVKKHE